MVLCDTMSSTVNGRVTTLGLLDLSAAFDTMDHIHLLHHLQHWFSNSGPALKCFAIYISVRALTLYT